MPESSDYNVLLSAAKVSINFETAKFSDGKMTFSRYLSASVGLDNRMDDAVGNHSSDGLTAADTAADIGAGDVKQLSLNNGNGGGK